MTHADEMDLTEIHWNLSEGLKRGDFTSKSDKYFAMRMVGKCKKGEDIGPEDEGRMRRLVQESLVGPLTEAEVAEVTHQSKTRLERLAEAVVLALKQLRCGEKPDADLVRAFRDELGPTERLFLAGASVMALDPDQKAGLVEAARRDALRETGELRAFNEIAYKAAVQSAKKRGDEAKARELEAKLRELEERWAREAADAA